MLIHTLRQTLAGLSLCLLFLTIGCSEDHAVTADPYRGEMEAARKKATSDFERDVLADLDISRAEYEEAIRRYVRCVEDQGVEIEAIPQSGYYTFGASGRDASVIDQAQTSCRVGTIDLIEPIYVDKLVNPGKQNMDELIAACLVRKGVAPSSYTGKQLKADRDNDLANAPFDREDDRVSDCHGNPSAN